MLAGRLPLSIAMGFIVSCIGVAARVYMDFSVNGWRAAYDLKRGSTELTYWRLVKQKGAPAWPLIINVTSIPLGILIVFGSIVWINHLRR